MMTMSSRERGGITIRYVRIDGTVSMNCLSLGWLQVFDSEDEAKQEAERNLQEYGPDSAYARSSCFSALKSYTLIKAQKGQRAMNVLELRIHELQCALYRTRQSAMRLIEE